DPYCFDNVVILGSKLLHRLDQRCDKLVILNGLEAFVVLANGFWHDSLDILGNYAVGSSLTVFPDKPLALDVLKQGKRVGNPLNISFQVVVGCLVVGGSGDSISNG